MEAPSFYLIAVIIAVVFLIICLTTVGILMKYQNAGQTFPPSAQPCPDGWNVGSDGSCGINLSTSLNKGRLTAISGSDLSSNSPYFNSYTFSSAYTNPVSASVYVNPATNKSATLVGDLNINFSLPNAKWTTCQQKNWANRYGIEWDGISNYNGSC